MQLAQRAVGVVHEVPLIGGNHKRAALFHHLARDGQILALQHNRGIDHQNHQLGEPDGALRFGDRQPLEPIGHVGPPPQPGGVHQTDGAAAIIPIHRNRVPGDPGFRPRDHPFGADEPVDQGGFADIGPSNHGEPQGTAVFVRHLPCGVGIKRGQSLP